MRAGWWLLTLMVLGCTDLAPTNPYDPKAPAPQQAKGVVEGVLALPGEAATAFEGASVTLFDLSAPTTPYAQVSAAAVEGEPMKARFRFNAVPAGQYQLRANVPGFALSLGGERLGSLPVQVRIGQTVALGELTLVENDADRFAVRGRVRLGGADDGNHAGTRVEAIGTPDVVFTDDEGGWELRLPAGRRSLRITRTRYASVDVTVDVVRGRGADVPEQVLAGDPAQVFGVLALTDTTDAVLLSQASVSLLADGELVDETSPGLGGSFAMGAPAGAYTVRLARGGYRAVEFPVVLDVGERRDLGRFELAVDGEAVARTLVRGRAERAGADDDGHGGILVELAGTPFAATTTSTGAFELGVAPGPVTLRFSADGYSPEQLSLPNVDEGATVDLEAEAGVVRLTGEPGTIQGAVALAGTDDPDRLQAVEVRLLQDAELVDEVAPNARGVFVFGQVPAGAYEVELAAAGYSTQRVPLTVAQAQVASAGSTVLPLDEEALGQTLIEGRVERAGADADGHGQILVEAVNTAFATTTTSDGRFVLPVAPGPVTLRFTAEGYDTEERVLPNVPAGETLDLEAEAGVVRLDGEPGQIEGSVGLTGVDDPARLQAVEVRLLRDAALVAEVAPNARGVFVFADVPAGDYQIRFTAAGFLGAALPATVRLGQLTQAGHTVLAVDEAVIGDTLIEGRAERAGADANGHGQILVEAVNTAFATTTTSDGRFVLQVAPGPVTLRFTADGYNAEERVLPNVPAGERLDLEAASGVVRLSGEPGRIRGVLGLAGVQNPATVRAALVELIRDDEVVDQTNPDGDGAYLLADIAPGRYALRLTAAGFDTLTFPVNVEFGATTQLPPLVLESADPGATMVSGRVERLGARPGQHGGIQVEVVGTDFATQTTSEGRFVVPVVPGAVQLRMSDRGYTPQEVQIPRVDAGTSYDYEDEVGVVRLVGEPATLEGLVTLARLSTADRVQRVTITLTPEGGGAPQTTNPDASGRFGLAGLAAGPYQLRVDGVGYDPVERPIDVNVGAAVDVGQVVLTHGADGPEAGVFEGRIQVADGRDNAGTVVRLDVAGDDLPFASVVTDADGSFQVLASREERYSLTLERDGYVVPEAAALGTFAWDDDIDLFLDPDGDGLDLVLDAEPVAGRVDVTVTVEPAWIPLAQRTATVEVRGVDAAGDDDTQVVGTGETAALDARSTGRFLVTVSREGFTSASQFVEISRGEPVVALDLTVTLNNLAAAGLDFDGETLEACALRGPYDLRQADFTGATLTGDFGPVADDACGGCGLYCGALDLTGVDLTGGDLSLADLSAPARASAVRLDDADLFGANLAGVDLSFALLRSADLFGADLTGALVDGAVLAGANLASASLNGARFTTLQPDGLPEVPCGEGGVRPTVELALVNWNQTDLRGALMAGVDLTRASLEGARMGQTNLRGACLQGARMVLNDLTQANLRDADLRGASLTSAILSETDFRGADLAGADLVNAVIEQARFDLPPDCAPADWDAADACLLDDGGEVPGKNWADAQCCRTHLTQANLNGANLIGADFRSADMADASLLGVTVGDAVGQPEDEPADCPVIERGVCWEACNAAFECDGTASLFEDGCEAFTTQCQRGEPIQFETVDELRAGMRCIREVVYRNAGQCGAVGQITVAACIAAPVESLAALGAIQAPTRCTYENVRAEGACPDVPDPDWAIDAMPVPAECTVARTRLSGARLDGAQMTALVLDHVELVGTRLRGTQLRNMLGFDLDIEQADFTGAVMREANLRQTFLRDADFTEADLSLALMERADLRGSDFTRAELGELAAVAMRASDVVFRDADLTGADLSQSNLSGADLTGAVLDGVSLNTGLMRDTVLTGATSERFLGQWMDLAEASLLCAAMDGTNLSAPSADGALIGGADLLCARWQNASLTGATLRGVRARRIYWPNADFTDAQLGSKSAVRGCGDVAAEDDGLPCGVLADDDLPLGQCRADGLSLCQGPASCNDFTGAVLTGAQFVGTTLGYTRLQGAQLANARFEGASLGRTNLTNASLINANFAGVDSDERMTLQNTVLANACLASARFTDVNLVSVDLSNIASDAAAPGCDGMCSGDGAWAQLAPDVTGECAGAHDAPGTDPRPDCGLAGRLTLQRAELRGSNWAGADLSNATFNTVTFGDMSGVPVLAGALFTDVTFGPSFDATAVDLTGAILGGEITFQGDYDGDASVDLRGVDISTTQGLSLSLLGNATYDVRGADLRGLCVGAEQLIPGDQSAMLTSRQTRACTETRTCLEGQGWDVNSARITWVDCGDAFAECRCDQISQAAP